MAKDLASLLGEGTRGIHKGEDPGSQLGILEGRGLGHKKIHRNVILRGLHSLELNSLDLETEEIPQEISSLQ